MHKTCGDTLCSINIFLLARCVVGQRWGKGKRVCAVDHTISGIVPRVADKGLHALCLEDRNKLENA